MHGNVWEWCSDWGGEDYYDRSPEKDPQGPADGTRRVLRGGGWFDYPRSSRCASRGGLVPGDRNLGTGLRVCVSVE
jgi:formylglycine-generating enzyme required for sulfatase activity